MESSSPENRTSNRKKVIQGLVQGRDLTNQLRMMFRQSVKADLSSVSADDLLVKILGTFTESLLLLNSDDSDEVSGIPASIHTGLTSCDGRKSEDSGESSKTSAPKNGRGSYKRRKSSETYARVTPTLIDDGYAWRKYGQKQILHAKHERNYYRCTHKFDQGCQANKQVQKTEDDPPKYRTTYHGHHTCKDLHKASQITLNSTNSKDSSFLLSFESKGILENNPENPYVPLMKQESKEQFSYPKHDQSASSDFFPYSDLMKFDPSVTTMLSSGSDHGDVISSGVYSCTTSNPSFEMDLIVGCVDFDDFQFEFYS